MTPYEILCDILRSECGWLACEAPGQRYAEQALAASSPSQVAATLEAFLDAATAQAVSFYGQVEATRTIVRRRLFGESAHFRDQDTGIALGLTSEPAVDTIGPAQSPSQWWYWQERGRNRLGELLCDAAEFARRNAHISVVPLEWRGPGMDPLIYQLAVREGYLPVGMERFDPAYLQSTPRLREVRGLAAWQWLENLQARDHGKPQPWLPGGAARSAP